MRGAVASAVRIFAPGLAVNGVPTGYARGPLTAHIISLFQIWFCGIFVRITEHQKGYIVYVPITRKIISSYDVVFDESFSSALPYTSRPYSEAMAMRHAVTYTPYAKYLK